MIAVGSRVTYYTGRGGEGTVTSVFESEGFALVTWDDGLGPERPYIAALRLA